MFTGAYLTAYTDRIQEGRTGPPGPARVPRVRSGRSALRGDRGGHGSSSCHSHAGWRTRGTCSRSRAAGTLGGPYPPSPAAVGVGYGPAAAGAVRGRGGGPGPRGRGPARGAPRVRSPSGGLPSVYVLGVCVEMSSSAHLTAYTDHIQTGVIAGGGGQEVRRAAGGGPPARDGPGATPTQRAVPEANGVMGGGTEGQRSGPLSLTGGRDTGATGDQRARAQAEGGPVPPPRLG